MFSGSVEVSGSTGVSDPAKIPVLLEIMVLVRFQVLMICLEARHFVSG